MPTVAAGSEVVVIKSGTAIEIQNVWFAVEPPAETCTVKPLVPPRVGVPEMTPVEEFKLSPAGRAPDVMDHA